jgi:hypothetical protein
MKKLIYILIAIIALPMVSCNDEFLNKTPLDEISEPEFWKTASDLELYATGFYNNLPSWGTVGVGYAVNPDIGTDVSLYTTESGRLDGNTSVPTAASGGVWNFTNVRKANYFIDNMSKAEGAEVEINHYKGEGYFFRAYYYFSLLQDYGDVPIIDKYIDNTDTDYLYAARDPRNKVADFILSDLDMAISLLKSKSALTSPRLSVEAALLFKARVALYEGTWEKYHAGTDFGVSGSDGSNYLGIAATAAKAIIDGGAFTLNSDYESNFNQLNLKSNKEIILWREYDYLTFGNGYGNDSQIWPNRSGYTRFAVRSYLCTDGLPISVSTLYKGDKGLDSIEVNRDPRLAATIMVPGDDLIIAIDGTVTPFTGPVLTTNNACVTAYEGQKYRVVNIDASTGGVSRNLSKIIMRYAEALLVYAEAKAELGTITQEDLDISINKLRDRVGMPHLIKGAITVDPNWPDYGYSLTDIIYEVRRERSVELMGEGFRFDDLMRWRAHKLFLGERPRGAYYEDFLKKISNKLKSDSDGYIDPYQATLGNDGYGFNPSRDYLSAIPTEEMVLNPKLVQNPGW